VHQINTCTSSEIARQAAADTLLHGDPILNQYNPQARLQEGYWRTQVLVTFFFSCHTFDEYLSHF
jgi:hypothetical protein